MSRDFPSNTNAQYEDLVDDLDPSTLNTIESIARAYTAVDPTPWLSGPPRRHEAQADREKQRPFVSTQKHADDAPGVRTLPHHIEVLQETLGVSDPLRSAGRSRRRMRTKLYLAFGPVLAALLLLISGVTNAIQPGSSITDLGKPTDVTSTDFYFPLSGFHRVKESIRQGKKPELLFLGVSGDYSAVQLERWPIVKALSQFGRLSGVKAVDHMCSTVHTKAGFPVLTCTLATFDFSHARFTSPYLAFSSKDLIQQVSSTSARTFQKMSPAENAIFTHYAAYKGTPVCNRQDASGKVTLYKCHTFVARVQNTLASQTQRTLPLVLIGNYVQTVTVDLVSGDFSERIPAPTPTSGRVVDANFESGYSFQTIHDALLHGKDFASSHFVEGVNGEANIMTALMCRADGMQPKSVCGRAVIKTILKSAK